MKSPEKLYLYIKILSVIGILLSVYLLWQQFFKPEFQPCYVNSLINCDAVISGAVAKTFGIPTPLYGLVGYIVIFVASMYMWKRVLLSVATFGLLFCLSLAYIELVQLKVVCPVCIACQVVMGAIFALAAYVVVRKE
jgi:uncharacterized membrane protein